MAIFVFIWLLLKQLQSVHSKLDYASVRMQQMAYGSWFVCICVPVWL